ncbi:hypothetical protein Dimus_036035, partial [Dionaea muscipula]
MDGLLHDRFRDVLNECDNGENVREPSSVADAGKVFKLMEEGKTESVSRLQEFFKTFFHHQAIPLEVSSW